MSSDSAPNSGAADPPHIVLGTTRIFDGGLPEAVALCREAMRARTGGTVATANLDFFAIARRDAQLRADLDRSWLVVADGAPVAWLGRLQGGRSVRRVTGVDLVSALFEERPPDGGELRVAVYGSTAEILARAAGKIGQRTPWVRIAAAVHPPFRPLEPGEEEEHIAALTGADPHLVLVALGCPRQERVIHEYYGRHPSAVWIGVGGTFDFFAGERRRAPRWAQAVGLEWAIRLLQEPGRLWRRYLLRDMPALFALLPSVARARLRGDNA